MVPVISVRQISVCQSRRPILKICTSQPWCTTRSSLSPYLFDIYMTPLADILRELGIEFHVYADVHQLYLAFQPIDQDYFDVAVNKIQRCFIEVKQWMVKNMLKLNNEKMEFIVIETREQRSKIDIPHININRIDIAPNSTVHNLIVMFDSEMSMKAHVSSINRSAYPQLKNLAAIKPFWIWRQQIQLFMHLLVLI